MLAIFDEASPYEVKLFYCTVGTEGSCGKHLLEVGVFCILNQLQQNSLCGGEVSSTLLQSGQSKQTVRLAAVKNTEVVTELVQ